MGRRLASAPWPARLAPVRAGAMKLAWTLLEARLVRTPVRYSLRELVTHTSGDYVLRPARGRITLRHSTGDIDIFRKFYGYDYYRWPDEVVARLSALGRPVNVLDLGANVGLFDVHAQQRFTLGSVVAFEPDPDNARVLERVRDANGAGWTLVRACASNRDGTAMFESGRQNFSRIGGGEGSPVQTVDVLPEVLRADLVKMNIEGSEWEILQDPRLADSSAIWIVEYHRIRNPEPDFHGLVTQLFERNGFVTRVQVRTADNGLMWAWRAQPSTAPHEHGQAAPGRLGGGSPTR